MTKAAAVHTSPRTSRATTASSGGVTAGGRAAANGVSRTPAIARLAPIVARGAAAASGRLSNLRPPAEAAAAARGARAGAGAGAGAEELGVLPRDADPDERDDAAQADQQPDEPPAGHALGGVEAQREHGDDQRRGSDDDRRDGRVDVLLAERDERERHRDLEDREREQPAAAAAQRRQRPGPPREREEHDRGKHDAAPGQERGRHAVVDRDLDEQ